MTSPQDEASCSYPSPPLTANPTYIGTKAKEILATREITGLTKLVTNLFYGKETEQSPSSKLLYETFTKNFPNILALKLLQVYRFASVSPKIRSFSLHLLDSLLIDLDDSRVGLKTEHLKNFKTHLKFCFFQRETSDHDFKILSRIVSRVAVDLFISSCPWEELCSYMISLEDNKKAMLIFSELPTLLEEEFLMLLLENGLGLKIVNGLLLNQDCDDEEWCLALDAAFSLILQFLTLEKKDLVWDLVYVIVKSVWEMVNIRGREIVVRKGFVKLVRRVRKEALRFREPEYEVVSRLALMLKKIHGVCEATEMAAKMIQEVLERYYIVGQDVDLGFIKFQGFL